MPNNVSGTLTNQVGQVQLEGLVQNNECTAFESQVLGQLGEYLSDDY